MLDIGWSEMLMIAVVAIVVIGPKDLPRTLRTIGQWIGKARAVTRDLQNSVNDMIAESEIEDLRKAGSSIGDFGASDILNQDFNAEPTSEKISSQYEDYPTPAPTPMKWPPDDDDDAVVAAAETKPDITEDEGAGGEDESTIPAKSTES